MIDLVALQHVIGGGDGSGRALLADLVPALPPAKRRVYRNAMVTLMCAWLLEGNPDLTVYRLVRILSEARHEIEQRRRLRPREPFHTLSRLELDRLEIEMRQLLEWGGGLPAERQLNAIVKAAFER